MKKILILLIGVFLLMGCSKKSNIDVAKEFENKVNKSKSYQIKGYLEIQNDGLIYIYCEMITTIGSAKIHLLIQIQ